MNIIKNYLKKLAIKQFKLKDPELTYGLNSNVGSKKDLWNSYHILMLDYDDNLTLPSLIMEIKQLQKKFNLSHCHIAESSPKKYHTFFFNDILNYFNCIQIIHETNCCKFFKKQRMLFDHITIRMSPKTYGHFLKPKIVHIEMNYPKVSNSKDVPNDVKDNARDLCKLYLSSVDYENEVVVNGS